MNPKNNNNLLKILLFVAVLIVISVCTVLYAEKLKNVINQVHSELNQSQNDSEKN